MILAAGVVATGAGVLNYRASGSQDRGAQTGQPSRPDGEVGSAVSPVRSFPDLFSAQARVGQRAYEQAVASYRDGRVDLEKVHRWSKRLVEAQVATATGSYVTDAKSRAIHVAAARAHRDRMGQLEEMVRARVEKGQDLPLSSTTAEYYRIEAEGLVLEYDREPAPASKGEERPRS